jgi:hypothetical protein
MCVIVLGSGITLLHDVTYATITLSLAVTVFSAANRLFAIADNAINAIVAISVV